ncbi:hypothetical protein AB0C13_07660 [Streptomyces sp. NPDC049099]|uniref:hypothetical protein n=1 Tax=Streptomyces sp. NPDC049099 TaxID=3155768 RepID=UPI003443E211
MIATFLVLIMLKKMSPIAALVLVPAWSSSASSDAAGDRGAGTEAEQGADDRGGGAPMPGVAPHERYLTARRASMPGRASRMTESSDERAICMKIV